MFTTPDILAQLPIMLALPVLLTLLVLLWRRMPKPATRDWFVTVSFIALAQIGNLEGWAISHHRVRLAGHTMIFIGEFMVGVTLASHRHIRRHSNRLYPTEALFNIPPLVAFSCCYGFYIAPRWPYVVTGVAGIVLVLGTAAWLRRGWMVALGGCVCWATSIALVLVHQDRAAAYLLLSAIYLYAIRKLYRTLPAHSLGKVAMLTSLSIWTISYLVHPIVLKHIRWFVFSTNVWELQKFFLCIGMLLVMLEDEVAESKWLALHDQLTELPNRRLLDDHLESALQRAERENGSVAIFVIDLNGFKAVNDTYGHPIGDFVLVESSRRMLGELRPEDMLARLGGDEFVIVVPCANDVEGLPKLQQRLEDTLAMPFNVGGQVVTVTGSLGMAMYPQDAGFGDTRRIAPELLHLADQRMFRRKAALQADLLQPA